MDDYLAKPVTRSELERTLARWWNAETAAAAAQRELYDIDPETGDMLGRAIAQGVPIEVVDEIPPVQEPDVVEFTAVPAAVAPTVAPPVAARPEPPLQPLPPVLDTEILDELRAMLGGDLDHLVDVFLADTPRLIATLEQAATGPDYDALRDAAHSLKSSSANLGAMSLSAAAKRVELGARERLLERPAVAVALVANEFNRARVALRAASAAQA